MADENKTAGYVDEDGAKYRVPYRNVRELTFKNIKQAELVDAEHSARLQYRLLLMDAVIRAGVDFSTKKITVTYNPTDNGMKHISKNEIVAFLEGQGIHVPESDVEEKEFDYYTEIYLMQYNAPSVRAHPPYGYTSEEWKRMKSDYEKKRSLWAEKNRSKFLEWQKEYLLKHPELSKELGLQQ
jgi:hypothetical protein